VSKGCKYKFRLSLPQQTEKGKVMFVPVVNMDNQPLMPTTPSRARRWILSKKATPFWKKGVFCVRLNIRTLENKQDNWQEEMGQIFFSSGSWQTMVLLIVDQSHTKTRMGNETT
jgi:hypothetical protein